MNIRFAAISLMVGAMLATGCAGRAATTAQAIENDLETIDAGEGVREFDGGEIRPDATLPLVIDFNADWCGPCRQFRPVFDKAAEERQGKAIFVSVNVDRNNQAARQFGVRAIPQISVLFPDGRVETVTGFMDATEFDAFLDTTLR